MTFWYEETGKDSDVVLSTAVMLYRNLDDLPFVHRLDGDAVRALCHRVEEAVADLGFERLPFARREETRGETPRETLGREKEGFGREKGKNDREEALLRGPGGALDPLPRVAGAACLLLSSRGNVGISLCAEEHLTIIARWPGLALTEALDEARTLDNQLDRQLTFAFSEKFGYYNARAEHLGPGLAFELLLFLPALSSTGTLAGLGTALSGFGVRLSSVSKDLCILSASAPLGKSEDEVAAKLRFLMNGILTKERELRASLYTEDADRYADRVYRALGLFKHARLLDEEEFMTAFSDLRLGVCLGMINAPTLQELTALFFEVQPAALGETGGRARDSLRADTVQRAMAACLSS